MPTRMSMLTGVFIGRRIAAKCCAAGLAGAQMHPRVTRFDAFFTNVFFGCADFRQRGQMSANRLLRHVCKAG